MGYLVINSKLTGGKENPLTNKDGSAIVSLGKKTIDERDIVAVNRIPEGFTIYWTGVGDDIGNGKYCLGNKLVLKDTSKTCKLQLINHYYAIGGRVSWSGASIDDNLDALLYATATTAGIEQVGDYNKYEVVPSSGLNIIAPVLVGSGTWDIDLTETLNSNVNILKCTPVPNIFNKGWFDYDTVTNIITRNVSQTGHYDLYDFDVDLFQFLKNGWAKPGIGSETIFETEGVVGKLLLNTWCIKFDLITENTGVTAGITMTIATKKNV